MLAIPADLVKFLEGKNGMPGFAREKSNNIKVAIATMLWLSLMWYKQHKRYPRSVALSRKEIRALFGSDEKFRLINRKSWCRHFLVSRYNNSSDKHFNYANGYQPTPALQAAFDRYLASAVQPSSLTTIKGNVRREPNAVASLDSSGNKAVGWHGLLVPSAVPVNLTNLRAIADYYRLLIDAARHGVLPSSISAKEVEDANWYWRSASALERLGSTPEYQGFILHQYVQSTAGRLYARGLNLQNCLRAIRKAALAGYYDYDITCCHVAILSQMAVRFGVETPALAHYIANKRQVRLELAAAAGITIDQVKTVISALIYGTQVSRSPRAAIPAEIGQVAADALYATAAFKAISGDIKKAANAIFKNHPTEQGRFVNDFRKALPKEFNRQQTKVLAHLVQGVEAVALRAAVGACKDKVLLLMHDGLATSEPVDPLMLTEAVLQATEGWYHLMFEGSQMKLDLPEMTGCDWINETKMMNQREASNHVGFGGFADAGVVTVGPNSLPVPPPYPEKWPSDDWTPPF